MGILDELKKALFGASSVAKNTLDDRLKKTPSSSTTKKVERPTQEEMDDKYTAEGKKMLEEMESGKDPSPDYLKDLDEGSAEAKESVERIKNVTEELGTTILSGTAAAMEKARELAKDAVEKGKESWEGKDGEEGIKDKVDQARQKLKDKFDETMQKAQDFAAEEEANKDVPYETSEKAKKALEESLLPGDDDDFWSKAEAFAEGRYDDVRDEGDITVIESTTENKPKELPPVYGMEDLDGDGNELIDDAILPDEEDSEDLTESEEDDITD